MLPARTRLVHVYTTDVPHHLGVNGLQALRTPVDRGTHWVSERAVVTLCPSDVVHRSLLTQLDLYEAARFLPGARLALIGDAPQRA